MDIKLKNTLGSKIQIFSPIKDGEVKMYHCGPTVYNYAHIGNLRAYVFADLLRRLFEYEGYKVNQVINITNFGHLQSDADSGDDKMTSALKREGKPLTLEAMLELGEFYANSFISDLSELNILEPSSMPRASEYVKADIEMIDELLSKEMVYKTSDGLYLDTTKISDYGKLSSQNIEELKDGARVQINPEKKNPIDFAVWKFNDEIGWESPWGRGFPGWHIECSGMIKSLLGDTIDIHTGGIDHINVHHTNEIAQSESANEAPLAKFWLHCNFITIDGNKISKSLKNEIYLSNLEKRGIPPIVYRYWLLTSNYQSQANFTWDALEASNEAYKRLVRFISESPELHPQSSKLSVSLTSPIYNNLDTATSLASIWELIKNPDYSKEEKIIAILEADQILGLRLKDEAREYKNSSSELPEDVRKLADQRIEAKANKDYNKSDSLRKAIQDAGYDVEDTQAGQKIIKK